MKTNMAAADPTYPLLPVCKFLSAAMLLLVMLTSLVRQNWNLGVAFLCFWLFTEALVDGTNYIIWSDNTEIKLLVYCDIGLSPGCSRRLELIVAI